MPLLGNGLALVDKSSTSSPFANHSYYTSGYQDLKKKRRELAMTKYKKHKKKKHSSTRYEVNEEPASMSSGLSAPRTRDPPKDELPSLYTEDLGTAGVKRKSHGPILSGPQVSFRVPTTADEEQRRKQRQRRFSNSSPSLAEDTPPAGLSSSLSTPRLGEGSLVGNYKAEETLGGSGLVGTCQSLEKPYLRLTTFPKAEDVRPLDVLTKSLAHIKCRYIKTEDFDWANEQFKSVRQDITVQGIRNDLVLDVYESHARLLLEHGDLNEFNQCQTMIKTLTTGMSNSGSDNDKANELVDKTSLSSRRVTGVLKQSGEAADEFGGYRLLYALVQSSSGDVAQELRNARSIVHQEEARASPDPQRSPRTVSCRHAALVVNAVTHSDYHAFFRLYESAPHLSAYLMDFLVKRVRMGAHKRIIASYRPTISVEYFRVALCFQDLEETRRFLRQNGTVFVMENGEAPFWIDCKASK